MLIIEQENVVEQLQDAVAFAAKVGALDELVSQLHYLSNYGGGEGGIRCVLFPDFAPMSFRFSMEKMAAEVWEPWFHGGLLYSGPGVNSDGNFPSLSVSLDPDCASGQVHKWSVHT